MSGRWGFRLRWALLAATVALLGARYVTSRCWVNRSVVVGGGGPPAVLVALSSSHRTIEKWDWNTNRMESIATFDGGSILGGWLCTGDGKFVWFNKGTLLVVDLEPPHEHREWKTTLASVDANDFKLVGTSANSRFAVVQCESYLSGSGVPKWEADLLVIDLQTGEEVSKKRWDSQIELALVSGEFTSRDVVTLLGNTQADWRLTNEGEWEELPLDPYRYDFVDVTKDAAGNFRGRTSGEGLVPGQSYESTTLKALSPGRKHVLRRDGNNVRLFLLHQGRRDVQVLPIAFSYFVNSSFTADGEHLVVDDVFGDVHVFQSETGRLVASTRSGLTWYCAVVAVAVAFMGIALSWLLLSFRQSAPLWAVVDLHGAAMAGQIAVFTSTSELQHRIAPEWMIPLTGGVAGVATAAFGIALGWYWSYGRASFISKLKSSGLSILAIALVPALSLASQDPPEYRLIRLVAPPFAGLFAASVTAFVLAPVGIVGWRASDEPLTFHARRFGLAAIMILIALVAVVLGFLKLILSAPEIRDMLSVVMVLLPTAVVGLALPALVILNASRRWRILLGIGVAAVVVGGMLTRTLQRGRFGAWNEDAAPYFFAAATTLVILVMAVLARKHGWRWRKAQALAGDVSSLEAAA